MSESEIARDFLVESSENLDRLDRDLVGLEKNPHNPDALAGVFRTLHTIKGTCLCYGVCRKAQRTVGGNSLRLHGTLGA
jgi:two-component system, chemotaxis family, sensor kinase CheA